MAEYAPIAKALSKANINQATKGKLKRKFNVAYMSAKENLRIFRKDEKYVFASWRKDMDQIWERTIKTTILVQLLSNLLLVNS